MTEPKLGLSAAVGATLGSAPPPPAQGDLLPAAPAGEGGADPLEKRGPGRPPGSPNRRTREAAERLVAKHGDPLARLGEIYSKSPTELVAEGYCKPGEGGKMIIAAAYNALPYVHGKLAPVNDKGETVTPLVVNLGEISPGESPVIDLIRDAETGAMMPAAIDDGDDR